MISGVKVTDSCIKLYNDMKIKHNYRYIIYGLSSDNTKIEPKSVAPPNHGYEQFVNDLKQARDNGQCRYGVYDCDFKSCDNNYRNKLVFFLWSPDNGVNVREKMLYTSSKDYLKRSFQGIGAEIQANDDDDLCWSNVLEHLLRKTI